MRREPVSAVVLLGSVAIAVGCVPEWPGSKTGGAPAEAGASGSVEGGGAAPGSSAGLDRSDPKRLLEYFVDRTLAGKPDFAALACEEPEGAKEEIAELAACARDWQRILGLWKEGKHLGYEPRRHAGSLAENAYVIEGDDHVTIYYNENVASSEGGIDLEEIELEKKDGKWFIVSLR